MDKDIDDQEKCNPCSVVSRVVYQTTLTITNVIPGVYEPATQRAARSV